MQQNGSGHCQECSRMVLMGASNTSVKFWWMPEMQQNGYGRCQEHSRMVLEGVNTGLNSSSGCQEPRRLL
jgi:hypothetical protein